MAIIPVLSHFFICMIACFYGVPKPNTFGLSQSWGSASAARSTVRYSVPSAVQWMNPASGTQSSIRNVFRRCGLRPQDVLPSILNNVSQNGEQSVHQQLIKSILRKYTVIKMVSHNYPSSPFRSSHEQAACNARGHGQPSNNGNTHESLSRDFVVDQCSQTASLQIPWLLLHE
jgi:hypothetical protein